MEQPDDLGDDAIALRAMGARLKRTLRNGQIVPGGEEIIKALSDVLIVASGELDPMAALADALEQGDDHDDENNPHA